MRNILPSITKVEMWTLFIIAQVEILICTTLI